MNEQSQQNGHVVRFGAILLFCIAVLYAAVCTPIYQWANTDIGVSEIFVIVWDCVQSLVRFSFFWSSAAFLLCIYRTAGVKQARSFLLLAGGAALLLHIGSLLAGLIMLRDFDTIGMDLLDLAIAFLLDVCQIALFYLFANRSQVRQAAISHVPTSALLACAAVPSAFQILLNRLPYDIVLGAPTGKTDLIVMAVYYLADLALVAIGYLVLLLVTDCLISKKAPLA